MPRAAQTKNYFNFIAGLNTEGSKLAFPESSCSAMSNVEVNRDGSLKRRRGLVFEGKTDPGGDADWQQYKVSASSYALQTAYVDTFIWRSVAGQGNLNFLVMQIGNILHIYNNSDTYQIENSLGTIDFSAYAKTSEVDRKPLSFAFGKGRLYVVGEAVNPFYVEYDPDTTNFSSSVIGIKVRDFDGVDDGLDVDTRPSTLSDTHKYNLFNQGWDINEVRRVSTNGVGVWVRNVFGAFFAVNGTYPANSDQVNVGLETNSFGVPWVNCREVHDSIFGNTPAPQGHYIIDLFAQNRSSVSGISGLSSTPLEVGFNCCAFYSARVFYGGINQSEYTDKVYFSQIMTEADKAGKCHQYNDPTSDVEADIIKTDGGEVTIHGAGTIKHMVPHSNALVVLCDNGVWTISGTENGSFAPDDFEVNKVSDVGTTSAKSVVEADGVIYYWSEGGIYVLQPDQVSGRLTSQSISISTIQSYYTEIDNASKEYVKGCFDHYNKKIYWGYNGKNANSSLDATSDSFVCLTDEFLVLDTAIGAWYPWTIALEQDTGGPTPLVTKFPAAPYISDGVAVQTVTENVTDGGVTVDDAVSGEEVTINVQETVSTVATLKTVIFDQDSGTDFYFGFGFFQGRQFEDFYIEESRNGNDVAGQNYTSHLETGYESLGDPMRDKQAQYVWTYFNRTETGFETSGTGVDFDYPSGCQMRAKWEWTDSSNSGRWSAQQQVYRLNRNWIPDDASDTFENGFPVVETKTKVRGKGKSLTLRFDSEDGKDFQLLGWSIPYSGVGTP